MRQLRVNISDKLSPDLCRPKKPFIGTYDEADIFLRDNEYILTGYRIGFHKFWITLKSMFM